jgi:hypothetical protein
MVLALAPLVALGCGGKGAKAPPASALVVQPLSSASTVMHTALPGPSVARSHLVGTIAGKALGPFIGRSTNGGLVAWIGPAERGLGQELAVVTIAQDGAPFGQPRVATTVPQEATSLIVRPNGTSRGGWLLAWSALLDRGESLSVLGVGPDGSSQKAAFDVSRTTDHVKWMDIVPQPNGGMCVWAEETPAGDANILVAPVDSDGKARGLPVRVARGMLGWAAARDGDGVVLALVQPGGDGAGGAGALSWLRLDGEGHARGAPMPIGTKPTVSGDVDVVPVNFGWLLGWTDRTSEDAQVTLATVDQSGKVTGPHHAMDAVGGASIVGLASGPTGVALAWTEPRGRARTMRSMHLASVSLDGLSAQPVTSIDVAAGAAPELVSTDSGFALLSTARACTADDGPTCDGDLVPSVIRFDGRLTPAQTEPLYVGDKRVPAALGWNLACLGDRCIALAADAASPTGVFAVDLAARSSPFVPPTTPPLPVDAPRIAGVVTVASGQPFADVATARVGEATLLVTLTTALEAVDERSRGNRAPVAVVAVRAFDTDGQPLGPASTISSRALPVGGVAIAPGGKPDDGEAVAWVARDDGDPQVHVAHLDRRGRRTNEVQLTTAKGDASDVAIAWAGDAEGAQAHWVVAWVDARDGNGEVYATTLDRDGRTIGRGQRITNAPGDASDVALLATGGGGNVWLAWADPRESPQDGFADIYAAQLRPQDATRVGSEARVLATAAHSRSPALGARGKDVGVAWIEEAPTGADPTTARAYGAMLAWLGPGGQPASEPRRLPTVGSGFPTAVALDGTTAGVLHVVLARAEDDLLSLDGIDLTRDPGLPYPLVTLDGPSSLDVAIGLTSGWLFWTDESADATARRVRRATVRWTR